MPNISEDEKELFESLVYAADENYEILYSDIARFFGFGNNFITRNHPLWGVFQRKCEQKENAEWKRKKYSEDPEWRDKIRKRNNAYFKKRYDEDEVFRRKVLDGWLRRKRDGYEGFIESVHKRKRSRHKLLRFLDQVDFTEDKPVILGKDFPEYDFSVLALLSGWNTYTIRRISRLLRKASAKPSKVLSLE